MKTFIFIILILLVSACTETARKNLSGKKSIAEKIVILKETNANAIYTKFTFKIKRLSTGTVDYIEFSKRYELNDTILYTFVE